MYDKSCKIFQQFKNRNTIYGCLPHKNISELKPWNNVYVDLIGPYSNDIRQLKTGGAIIKNNVSLIWITIIDPATGWFENLKVTMYDLDEAN